MFVSANKVRPSLVLLIGSLVSTDCIASVGTGSLVFFCYVCCLIGGIVDGISVVDDCVFDKIVASC